MAEHGVSYGLTVTVTVGNLNYYSAHKRQPQSGPIPRPGGTESNPFVQRGKLQQIC